VVPNSQGGRCTHRHTHMCRACSNPGRMGPAPLLPDIAHTRAPGPQPGWTQALHLITAEALWWWSLLCKSATYQAPASGADLQAALVTAAPAHNALCLWLSKQAGIARTEVMAWERGMSRCRQTSCPWKGVTLHM